MIIISICFVIAIILNFNIPPSKSPSYAHFVNPPNRLCTNIVVCICCICLSLYETGCCLDSI